MQFVWKYLRLANKAAKVKRKLKLTHGRSKT